MQESTRATRRAVTDGKLAASLLLMALGAPALAATGVDVLCDRSADPIASLDIAVEAFAISVVEHAPMPTTSIESEVEAGRTPATDDPRSMIPDDRTILRRIFDERTDDEDGAAKSTAAKPANVASSVVELVMPDTRERAVEVENPDRPAVDAELPGVDPRLPGVSEEETLRYRRQMFRTDI